MTKTNSYFSHPKYRPDIDGLRAVAVLSVVIYHAFPAWLPGGFIGVDIFFVISGFLISTIIFENLDQQTFSFTHFYGRRIKRIFPALLVVLTTCLMLGWFTLLADEYKQLGKHIATGAGFVANFAYWMEAGYFDNAAETKPLLHLWSLGIEEQFYIIWPVLLWLAWRLRITYLPIILAAILASFLLSVYVTSKDSSTGFYLPHTRFWELLCGSLLAWLTVTAQQRNSMETGPKRWFTALVANQQPLLLRNTLSIIGAGLLIIGCWLIDKDSAFPGSWAMLPVAGAFAIIAAGPQAWINRHCLSNRILVWIGLISFPLYLWHWPLLTFLRIMEEGTPATSLLVGAVILSIVLSWLTYRFIESPIRHSGSGHIKTAVLALLMLGIGLAGYYAYKNDGLTSRPAVQKINAAAGLYQPSPHHPSHNEACDTVFPVFKHFSACLLSMEALPKVLLLGDSHSTHYYKSLARMQPDISVMNLAEWSCLPFSTDSHARRNDCGGKISSALEFATQQQSIEVIYLAGHWAYLASGGFKPKNPVKRLPIPVTAEAARSFRSNALDALKILSRSGKEIIFINSVPSLGFNIRSCFDSRPVRFSNKIRENCAIDRADFDKRNKENATLISQILNNFPDIKTYDPSKLLCDDQKCSAVHAGKPLYFDSDHLTLYGADRVVNDLLNSE